MTVATTYEERMALIASIAPKYNKRAAMRRSVKASGERALNVANKKERGFTIPEENDNIYAYTDASKYAKEYYGETLYETTRYDNDWGDY